MAPAPPESDYVGHGQDAHTRLAESGYQLLLQPPYTSVLREGISFRSGNEVSLSLRNNCLSGQDCPTGIRFKRSPQHFSLTIAARADADYGCPMVSDQKIDHLTQTILFPGDSRVRQTDRRSAAAT